MTGITPVHNSTIGNKMDPRVDSDFDGSRNLGATQVHTNDTLAHGTHGTHAGVGSHTGGLAGTHTTGTHTGGLTGAHGTTGSHVGGLTGSHATTGTHTGVTGTHGSHTGGLAGTGSDTIGNTSVTAGSGTAKKTSGPHNSDLLNKLDPRVDSDLDGSKTLGPNKTLT